MDLPNLQTCVAQSQRIQPPILKTMRSFVSDLAECLVRLLQCSAKERHPGPAVAFYTCKQQRILNQRSFAGKVLFSAFKLNLLTAFCFTYAANVFKFDFDSLNAENKAVTSLKPLCV